jgi:hypothetical protein
MDPARSGLYIRYQLLVNYVMNQKRVSAQALLTEHFDQQRLEREVRCD